MFGTTHSRLAALVCGSLLGVTLTACDDSSAIPPEDIAFSRGNSGDTPADLNRQLAELRQATAPFHDFGKAQEAGYDVLVTHPESGAECLAHPTLGAMGLHYLNVGLVDDEVAAGSPEVVIYEPDADGRLGLVAVEYIIPFAIRAADEPPPTLFGQQFMQNHIFDLWALHAWVWKHNPSGMFAHWNPSVSCEGA